MAKPMTKTEWLNWLEKAWDEAQQAAWNEKGYEFECPRCGHCCQVRTHTPEDVKKIESKWVGLTDEELDIIINKEIGFNSCWGVEESFARAIEAKLREKNA